MQTKLYDQKPCYSKLYYLVALPITQTNQSVKVKCPRLIDAAKLFSWKDEKLKETFHEISIGVLP